VLSFEETVGSALVRPDRANTSLREHKSFPCCSAEADNPDKRMSVLRL